MTAMGWYETAAERGELSAATSIFTPFVFLKLLRSVKLHTSSSKSILNSTRLSSALVARTVFAHFLSGPPGGRTMPPTTTKLSDLDGGAYGVGASWAVSLDVSTSCFAHFVLRLSTLHPPSHFIGKDSEESSLKWSLTLLLLSLLSFSQSTGMNVNRATVKAGLARAGGETWEDILDYYNVCIFSHLSLFLSYISRPLFSGGRGRTRRDGSD